MFWSMGNKDGPFFASVSILPDREADKAELDELFGPAFEAIDAAHKAMFAKAEQDIAAKKEREKKRNADLYKQAFDRGMQAAIYRKAVDDFDAAVRASKVAQECAAGLAKNAAEQAVKAANGLHNHWRHSDGTSSCGNDPACSICHPATSCPVFGDKCVICNPPELHCHDLAYKPNDAKLPDPPDTSTTEKRLLSIREALMKAQECLLVYDVTGASWWVDDADKKVCAAYRAERAQ